MHLQCFLIYFKCKLDKVFLINRNLTQAIFYWYCLSEPQAISTTKLKPIFNDYHHIYTRRASFRMIHSIIVQQRCLNISNPLIECTSNCDWSLPYLALPQLLPINTLCIYFHYICLGTALYIQVLTFLGVHRICSHCTDEFLVSIEWIKFSIMLFYPHLPQHIITRSICGFSN